MNTVIQKISPAIMDSHKIRIQFADGNNLVVHPHIVVRQKQGKEILKTMLDNGDCMDIPIEKSRVFRYFVKALPLRAHAFSLTMMNSNWSFRGKVTGLNCKRKGA